MLQYAKHCSQPRHADCMGSLPPGSGPYARHVPLIDPPTLLEKIRSASGTGRSAIINTKPRFLRPSLLFPPTKLVARLLDAVMCLERPQAQELGDSVLESSPRAYRAVKARKLELDSPPTPNQRNKEHHHKLPALHPCYNFLKSLPI